MIDGRVIQRDLSFNQVHMGITFYSYLFALGISFDWWPRYYIKLHLGPVRLWFAIDREDL